MLYSILKEIKSSITVYCQPLRFILIGSNKDGIIHQTDLDIVIIMDESVDLTHLINIISPSIKEIIVKYNLYISVFPIKESHYQQLDSEFIYNVKNTGVEF